IPVLLRNYQWKMRGDISGQHEEGLVIGLAVF
ncbi:unnamed protein product, partial [marine sediment metagenome]